jgi:hypothetical protein
VKQGGQAEKEQGRQRQTKQPEPARRGNVLKQKNLQGFLPVLRFPANEPLVRRLRNTLEAFPKTEFFGKPL